MWWKLPSSSIIKKLKSTHTTTRLIISSRIMNGQPIWRPWFTPPHQFTQYNPHRQLAGIGHHDAREKLPGQVHSLSSASKELHNHYYCYSISAPFWIPSGHQSAGADTVYESISRYCLSSIVKSDPAPDNSYNSPTASITDLPQSSSLTTWVPSISPPDDQNQSWTGEFYVWVYDHHSASVLNYCYHSSFSSNPSTSLPPFQFHAITQIIVSHCLTFCLTSCHRPAAVPLLTDVFGTSSITQFPKFIVEILWKLL